MIRNRGRCDRRSSRTASLLAALLLASCSTPEPLADLHDGLAQQQQALPSEVMAKPLNEDDAVRLAVAHNLDARVKGMEQELASGKAELAQLAMLPSLNFQGAAVMRSAPSEYSSASGGSTGNSGSNYSTSEDKNNATADLTASWNLVDLGLAVLRSGEEDDRVILAAEKRRRALHLLVQDVRTAYWKAVVNETAERRYLALEKRLGTSVDLVRGAEADRVGDPMQMLTHQRAIIETMRQIAELQRQTATARTELAGLMGVPSVSSFQLESLEEGAPLAVSPPAEDMDAQERQALADRPETHADEVQFHIDVQEVRAEMLKTLPGIGPFLGGHYDSTSYLLQNAWADAGVHVAYSLNELITAPARNRQANNAAELTRAKRMVTAMAVLTQLHVADDLYRHAYREYTLTEQLAQVDGRISQLSGAARKTGYGSEIEEIKARASSALSGLRRIQIYAELEGAKARIDAALGRNPWDEPKPEAAKDEPAPAAAEAAPVVAAAAMETPATPAPGAPLSLLPPATTAAAEPASAPAKLVRLASYRTEKDARIGWAKMRHQAPALSGEPVLRSFDAGSQGVYVRLFAPAKDTAQAKEICAQTARMTGGCTVTE